MAPEIIRKVEHMGYPADVWALGVMLYLMLTGHYPFRESARDKEKNYRLLTGQYEIPPHFSAPVAGLIRRMLDINASSRIKAADILTDPWLQAER
jgi:serine/threonine protein kinase